MADNQANDSGGDAQKAAGAPTPSASGNTEEQNTTSGQDRRDVAGGNLGGSEAARVPPGSKAGTETRQDPGGGRSVGGPGGPDAGSNAMPGRSNAL